MRNDLNPSLARWIKAYQVSLTGPNASVTGLAVGAENDAKVFVAVAEDIHPQVTSRRNVIFMVSSVDGFTLSKAV